MVDVKSRKKRPKIKLQDPCVPAGQTANDIWLGPKRFSLPRKGNKKKIGKFPRGPKNKDCAHL